MVPIARVRVAADVPRAERMPLEVLRTGTTTRRSYVDTRRWRRDP